MCLTRSNGVSRDTMRSSSDAMQSACVLLFEIQERYNREVADKPIKIYASCDEVLVAASTEEPPGKEYGECDH